MEAPGILPSKVSQYHLAAVVVVAVVESPWLVQSVPGMLLYTYELTIAN